LLVALVLVGVLGGCRPGESPKAPATETATQHRLAHKVLVVANRNSAASQEIARYYMSKRGVPTENLVLVNVPVDEEVDRSTYAERIEDPVRSATRASIVEIDYIVLTKGVPLRLRNLGYSVDAWLAGMNLPVKPIARPEPAEIERCRNPYYDVDAPFSSGRFGLFLVTRLDGYSVESAKALVDRAIAAKPSRGLFLFDEAANRKEGSFGETQATLALAAERLKARGLQVQLDQTTEFAVPATPLMGYASWGSNDNAYRIDAYRKLKFAPGSIAETFVSTSARTFLKTTGGQSLIADLIDQGVTGVKGYVNEPYTFAMANPAILFDRYTSGRNLAQSFYAASPVIKWKDLIIGDPLCAPYEK